MGLLSVFVVKRGVKFLPEDFPSVNRLEKDLFSNKKWGFVLKTNRYVRFLEDQMKSIY